MEENIKTEWKEEKTDIKKLCFILIVAIIFLATAIQFYSMIYIFFKEINLPDIFFNKSVVIAFLILFDELEIAKLVIIYKYSKVNYFCEFLYCIAFCSMAVGLVAKLVYIVGVSSILLTVLTVYQTIEDDNYHLLFFVNLIMSSLSTLFTIFIYVLCLIN